MENMSKRELNQRLKRKAILENSAKLFVELGYHNTKVDDIISAAGIGKGTFYLYYKNKEEVVHAFIDIFIEDFNLIHDG